MNDLWKHILYPHGSFRSDDEFRGFAERLGYSMYMWNGTVYETSTGKPNGIKADINGGLTS